MRKIIEIPEVTVVTNPINSMGAYFKEMNVFKV